MARILVGNFKGIQGLQGDPGLGFPSGGSLNQYLKKASSEDYDTEWGPEVRFPQFSVPGDLTTGTNKAFLIAPFDMTIIGLRAAVLTAPTGADLIVDVNVNGDSVYTTQANRPTIDAGETSVSGELPDEVSILEGDMVSIDIDQIGSTISGSNLAVLIYAEVVDIE